ncbi:MAG: GntR family transcriptional regulator [Verrucomicrobiota bacterium]
MNSESPPQRRSRKPVIGSKQEEIFRALQQAIEEKRYQVGDYLPSTRQLALEYHTSVTPIQRAYSALADMGYIEKIHGSGIRVKAISSNEAKVLLKPQIELVTCFKNPSAEPQKIHMVQALEEWLVWHLTRSDQTRVSLNVINDDERGKIIQTLGEMRYLKPDTLVFARPDYPSVAVKKIIKQLVDQGTKVCCFAGKARLPYCDLATSDFESGQYKLTKYLLEHGHHNILRLQANPVFYYEAEKQKGFERAMLEHGLDRDEIARRTVSLSKYTDIMTEIDSELLESIVGDLLDDKKITAVMALNDISVLFVRRALRRMGREDIEVAGYDAIWNEVSWPMIVGPENYDPEEVGLDKTPISVDTHLPEVAKELANLAVLRAKGELPQALQRRRVDQTLVCLR